MASKCILAVDQGTTNTKGLLMDQEGRIAFRSAVAVSLIQPVPGFIEQDPVELWQSTCKVLQACAAHAARAGLNISGIAICNQRETAVAWRRVSGKVIRPVCNAISWQCRRSEPICEQLFGSAQLLRDRGGVPLDPLLTATKWAWLLSEQPELRSEMESGEVLLGTVDSWLLYNLTNGRAHATDLTNASRVALLNLEGLNWDDELLALFGIPRTALPDLRASAGVFGECSAVPELSGVPIAAMIGDSQGALVGHGSYGPGSVKATYGTGSSLMMLTPELPKAQRSLARTIAWSVPEATQYAFEGNIPMSGAALQWVGEFLGLPHPVEDAAALAEGVPSADGVVFVPAMVGLGAPHWDASARGTIANLGRAHTAAHLARAALDAIAMQVTDVLEEMECASGVKVRVLLADGGATRNHTLMQMQADVLKRRVRRSAQEELSARGAALLGGLALGWWSGMSELADLETAGEWFEPGMEDAQRMALRERWMLGISRARLREGMTVDRRPCGYQEHDAYVL